LWKRWTAIWYGVARGGFILRGELCRLNTSGNLDYLLDVDGCLERSREFKILGVSMFKSPLNVTRSNTARQILLHNWERSGG
jgi:hypothetical protein